MGRATITAGTALAALALLATGCGDNSSSKAGPAKLSVTLTDFDLTPSAPSAKAGVVTFAAENRARATDHEFVVVRTDLAIKDLPVDETGAFDERGKGVTFIDEREDIKPLTTVTLQVDLTPGKYVLICNLEDHYQRGMVSAFQVT